MGGPAQEASLRGVCKIEAPELSWAFMSHIFVEFAVGLMAAALPSFRSDSARHLPSVPFFWCYVLSEQLKRFVVQMFYNPSIQRASQKLQESGFESFDLQRTTFTFRTV